MKLKSRKFEFQLSFILFSVFTFQKGEEEFMSEYGTIFT